MFPSGNMRSRLAVQSRFTRRDTMLNGFYDGFSGKNKRTVFQRGLFVD
jgi:hypothetical protein